MMPPARRDRTRLKVLLLGYYGRSNTGDDAMVVALARRLKKWFPACDLRITTNHPERLSAEIRGLAPEQVPLSVRRLAQSVAWSDAVVLGGGTHFHDLASNPRYLWLLLRFSLLFCFARLLRKRVILVGVGIGPLRTRWGRGLVGVILRLSSMTIVRDQESLRLASQLGRRPAGLGFDLASSLPLWGSPKEDTAKPKRVLGVNLLPAFDIYYGDPDRDTRLVGALTAGLAGFLEGDPSWLVRLISFKDSSEEGDAVILASLRDQLDRRGVLVEMCNPSGGVERIAELVRQCDAMIAMRYHACLFAYLCGVPSLWIDYHPKNRWLGADIGLPTKGLVGLEDALELDWADRLLALANAPESFTAHRRVNEMTDRLEWSLSSLRQVLELGKSLGLG